MVVMGALKQRALASNADREAHQSPLERAVDEAERDLTKGHSIDHDEIREKLRRWADGDA